MKKLLTILLFLSLTFSQSVITGVKDMSTTGLDSTASLGDVPAGMITMLNKGGTSTQAQWGLSFSDITDRFGSVAFGGYSRDNSATNSFAKAYSDSGYVFLEVQYNSSIDGEADFIRKTVANDGVVWDVVNATTSHDMSYLLFGGGQAWSKVGQFNPSGSIGNQSITGIGGTPNAVLFMSYQENDGGGHVGNDEPDGRFHFGFMADNGGQFAISSNIRNSNLLASGGASATNAYNTITTNAINDYFSYVSMDVDGFTVNWGNAESSSDYIQYMAIGGVEAYVDTTVMRTSTGTFSESGFGFQPDFIIGARTGRTSSGAGDHSLFGIGFASGTGTTEQYYMTLSARNNQDPTVTDQHSDDTYFLLGTTNTGAVESFLDIDSFDADGVTFNQIDASSAYAMFGYLAIKILDAEEDNTLLNGLISYWKFDEASGALIDAHDGNNGTISGTVTQGSTGKINDAYTFGGGHIFISETDFDFALTDPFSISGWIKTSTDGQSIVGKINNAMPYIGWDVEVHGGVNTGRIGLFLINLFDSDMIWVASTNTINNNAWRRFAATYDGSEDAGGVTIYIDDSSETPIVLYNNFEGGESILNNEPLRIGDRGDGGDAFTGLIDEVGIWNRELTTTEITALFNSGAGLAYPFGVEDNALFFGINF